ncbi:hypothetical protein HGRIS_005310 [Hohenbuehelia grisea]|uniref:Glucose-methanol-choline oxidoreductase N-terminal domain-containing protein n=1 Tax=Hohenbuehelia grisea TaxID=104357 RepID=A0ABR3JEP3_9AGAR
MVLSTKLLLLITGLAPPALGALFNGPSQFSKRSYDYVIVGGGTAGNVVASRLTEDPRISVLVLEAGISHENVTDSEIPLFCASLTPNTRYDWNYTTVAQPQYNNRTIPYARGRMLGGSSSVNYNVFMRGSSGDWNRYADVTSDAGWNWANMQKYILRNEQITPPADGHNTSGQYIPSHHGTSGNLRISLPGYPTPLDSRVLATLEEQKNEFPFNPDMGGGDVLGIGWMPSSIGHGQRSSSATAFLEPALRRRNLDVVINAHVTRLLRTGTVRGRPSFHCLEFTERPGARVQSVCATKEIVLSAGSVSTPILLQRSGYGDRNQLRAAGIQTIVHNPSVGRNLSDHPLLTNAFTVKGNGSFDELFRDQTLMDAALGQWNANRTGPLVSGVASQLGWLRLPNNASIFKDFEDPASGPRSAHWEIILNNFWAVPGIPRPDTGNFVTITTALISPTSRGYLTISSADPFAAPIIDPNFLSSRFDFFVLIEAVKAVKRFASGKAWADYIDGPYGDFARTNTDEEIEAYVRANAASIYHPVGTASMSPRGASWGVVDPDLKVKGVEGLRIVDGSVLPYVTNAPTQGPIYLVGERGADLIKADQ